MHRYLLHNGEIHETSERIVSPGQVGFLNGWGVFSTLRVCEGILFAFDRHYQRMQRDSERLHVPFSIPPLELRRQLETLIQANSAFNATLRVAVIRNKGGLFEAPNLAREADLVAFTANLTKWNDGVKLKYQPFGRFGASPFSGTKITSWAQNLTWYEEAHEQGFDECILLNEFGAVSELTSANIFAIREDEVLTPALETSGCLPGVTRAILLEEIRVPGLTIAEAEISPSELEASDQVFITSTTRDLVPVLSIEDVPLQQDRHKLAALQDAFSHFRASYNAAYMAATKSVSV